MVRLDSRRDHVNYLPPLHVTYQLLAGQRPATKSRYLCVGLPSVKSKTGSYLIPTLQSLFATTSPKERSSMAVVVLLADFDVSWRTDMVKKIKSEFSSALQQGHLLVFHVPEENYSPLTDQKRNNDSSAIVAHRSKQNLDYAFLVQYSLGLGSYYLQLGDEISAADNFPTIIKKCVEEQDAKKTTWATLEFSSLASIGKLYKSTDLPLLARFLFLFHQRMPSDLLTSTFPLLLAQQKPIIEHSLFKHMGTRHPKTSRM
ncbi:alpha-1,3-mannosyl-glycoprotein 4-beta-N-acetylglucosaminyltransferase C-like [Phyllopteryx taeniolatus]|uniref:alpha-1,3-mannosyl-glycoprotein 4-beta-N-acetylglucosaminyltransferase C-like n=1 Tax=Phyllopteryx taeniolatus TaxID=161469 RepID=UPI002AD38447|nr:alpha-1,3-mannosyl-glycoprotein 4-beta-N-acetylglucosaminyltransferase C-like [Phyllopteryx taeniolatus]